MLLHLLSCVCVGGGGVVLGIKPESFGKVASALKC